MSWYPPKEEDQSQKIATPALIGSEIAETLCRNHRRPKGRHMFGNVLWNELATVRRRHKIAMNCILFESFQMFLLNYPQCHEQHMKPHWLSWSFMENEHNASPVQGGEWSGQVDWKPNFNCISFSAKALLSVALWALKASWQKSAQRPMSFMFFHLLGSSEWRLLSQTLIVKSPMFDGYIRYIISSPYFL